MRSNYLAQSSWHPEPANAINDAIAQLLKKLQDLDQRWQKNLLTAEEIEQLQWLDNISRLIPLVKTISKP